MNWLEPVFGFVLVLLAAVLLLIFTFQRRGRQRAALRPIRAMQRMRRAIGLAVEDGSRLHVSIGKASIISPNNASALVGLSTLDRVGTLSSVSDRPPVVTSGDGTLTLLSQATLRGAYRAGNIPDQYDPLQARLTGPTPFSYIAGALPVVQDERVSTNVLVGNFGPEVGLLIDAANRDGGFTLAASDAFAAQAVIYAVASEPLIGEELFAVPAYLQAAPIFHAGLRVQDVLRWVVVAVLLIGSILAFLGFL